MVSFDFGSSQDWSHFSVYYCFSNGRIFMQCPVVPLGCVVPDSLLSALEARQQGEISRLQNVLERLQRSIDADRKKKLRKTQRLIDAATRGLKWVQNVKNKTGYGQVEEPLVQGPFGGRKLVFPFLFFI